MMSMHGHHGRLTENIGLLIWKWYEKKNITYFFEQRRSRGQRTGRTEDMMHATGSRGMEDEDEAGA